MKKPLLITALAAGLALSQAQAAPIREVSGEELRSYVARNQAMPFGEALRRVRAAVGGKLLDARAFSDGRLYYRIVMIQSDGRMLGVIMDAATGAYVSPSAAVVGDIAQAVKGSRRSAGTGSASETQSADSSESSLSSVGDAVGSLTGTAKDTLGTGGSGSSSTGSGGGGSGSGGGGGLGGLLN